MPPTFTPDIQPTLLKNPSQIHSDHVYGAITLYGEVFPVLFQLLQDGLLTKAYKPHLPLITKWNSVCPTTVFARRYSRYHNCFLFLCLLRCFNSAGSRSHKGSISKRRKWEVPLGNPGFKGCMLLAQAISLLAATLFGDSSQAIPQMV